MPQTARQSQDSSFLTENFSRRTTSRTSRSFIGSAAASAHGSTKVRSSPPSRWNCPKERKSKSKSARRSRRESPEREDLFQCVGAVEGVALGGDVAGVGDDAAELGFVGAVAHAGGVNDVFFDEDAAHIVGAELQAHLADFDPRRQPA